MFQRLKEEGTKNGASLWTAIGIIVIAAICIHPGSLLGLIGGALVAGGIFLLRWIAHMEGRTMEAEDMAKGIRN